MPEETTLEELINRVRRQIEPSERVRGIRNLRVQYGCSLQTAMRRYDDGHRADCDRLIEQPDQKKDMYGNLEPAKWIKRTVRKAGSCMRCTRVNQFVYTSGGLRLCRGCIKDAGRSSR